MQMNELPSETAFLNECRRKYKNTPIPDGIFWEDAHVGLPKCLKGKVTEPIWSSDHSLLNLIQSEEHNHPCIHTWAREKDLKNLSRFYPKFIPLYFKWVTKLSSHGGKAGGQKVKDLNLGICGLTSSERLKASRKGGKVGGSNCHKMGSGIHSEEYKNSEEYLELRKKNGKNNVLQKKGIHSDEYKNSEKCLENHRKNASLVNEVKWISLKDGFISTAAGVAHHNRSKGWDPSLRKRITSNS